jgi:hypothetical protein
MNTPEQDLMAYLAETVDGAEVGLEHEYNEHASVFMSMTVGGFMKMLQTMDTAICLMGIELDSESRMAGLLFDAMVMLIHKQCLIATAAHVDTIADARALLEQEFTEQDREMPEELKSFLEAIIKAAGDE